MGYKEYLYKTGNKFGVMGHVEWLLMERATLATATAMETYSFYQAVTNTSTLVRAITLTHDTTTALSNLSRVVRDT